MMVSEICNSLKEEKEDASSTNCVLEERDKITLKNKNKNKNKEPMNPPSTSLKMPLPTVLSKARSKVRTKFLHRTWTR